MFVAVFPATPTPALTAALIDGGFQPVPVGGPTEVENRVPPGGWAAAVIELGDDAGHGVIVARKISELVDLPVLVVADRFHTEDLAGEDGFDDFLLSPIDRMELRIRLLRLTAGQAPPSEPAVDVLWFDDLELNTATYQATVGGRPQDLTYMEYELLRYFLENPGRVWSREQILSKVWGYDYFGGSRTVDVHVRRLRAKLGEERAGWITTVRSVGYRFG